MNVIAIIPAFGGQKDMAGKSTRRFAGRPLITHTIEQARAARQVDGVVVATNDAEVARIARDWGIETVSEPTDTKSGASHARVLQALDRWKGVEPGFVVVLEPICPLRTPEMIDGAIVLARSQDSDCVTAVHPVGDVLWRREENGLIRRVGESGSGTASPSYAANGSMAVVKTAFLRETDGHMDATAVPYEIPRGYALRLENEQDWVVGEVLYQRFWPELAASRLRGVRLLALDFDGVMTDNRVIVLQDGREAVLCSRGDGMGLDLLRASGVAVAVISKEGNPVVTARCSKLKIPCVQGVGDKLPVLESMVREQGLDLDAVAFMGNDVNDLECMRAVGVAIAPTDSHPAALRVAHIVTTGLGGIAAVREVADVLISLQGGTHGVL